MFEKETIDLYNQLIEDAKKSDKQWAHSPVEDWKVDYFASNLTKENLIHFKRTPLVEGVFNFPDRPLRKSDDEAYEPWLSGLSLWQKLRGLRDIILSSYVVGKYFKIDLKEMSDDAFGKPCYYGLGNTKVTDLGIRAYFYQKYLEKHFSNQDNILEIGGGFGGLCRKLMGSSVLKPKRYFYVDLPENLVLAFYYFKNININVKIFDGDINEEGVVYIIPPWRLPALKTRVDLFINTMSFQHMTRENITYYLSEVERLGAKNIFLVNRDRIIDKTDVKISDYPISKKYQTVLQEKYPFSNHLIKITKLHE